LACLLLPYGLALVVTVTLICLRYSLNHLLGGNLFPLMIELAVLVSAWSGGLGPDSSPLEWAS
jgi:hypothetical protein